MNITPSQLQLVFPTAPPDRLKQVVDELQALCGPAELDTPLRLAHFFAQVRQEAGAARAYRFPRHPLYRSSGAL